MIRVKLSCKKKKKKKRLPINPFLLHIKKFGIRRIPTRFVTSTSSAGTWINIYSKNVQNALQDTP